MLSRTVFNFLLDSMLLVVTSVLLFTGAVLRFVFPAPTAAAGWTLWGQGYDAWANFQFMLLAVIALAILLHVMMHWSWVCGVVVTKLLRRSARSERRRRQPHAVGRGHADRPDESHRIAGRPGLSDGPIARRLKPRPSGVAPMSPFVQPTVCARGSLRPRSRGAPSDVPHRERAISIGRSVSGRLVHVVRLVHVGQVHRLSEVYLRQFRRIEPHRPKARFRLRLICACLVLPNSAYFPTNRLMESSS